MRLTLFVFLMALRLSAQTVEITPARPLIDERVNIRVSGCRPGEHLTIHAELADGANGR